MTNVNQIEKTVITWDYQGEITARKIGSDYEKKGMPIIYHGYALDDDIKKIGEDYDATHLLHFIDVEDIILVSYKDEMGGFTVPVKVKDLI